MKFDRLIGKYITEAQNLPPRIRLGEEDDPTTSKAGALAQFLRTLDPDVIGAARGKASVDEEGQTVSRNYDVLRAKIGDAYSRLMSDNFDPKDDNERYIVDKFVEFGIGPEAAQVLALIGSKIAVLLQKFRNLEIDKPKRIPLFDAEGELLDRSLTIPEIARNVLEKFYKIFEENQENGNWNELGSDSLSFKDDGQIIYNKKVPSNDKKFEWRRKVFKQLIDILRYFTNMPQLLKANKKYGWQFQMTQKEAKNSYLALDIRSTPTNWIIFTKKGSTRKDPSLRQVYGKMSQVISNRLTSDENLPVKFVNGVPQYGTPIDKDELFNLSNREFLELIGYETIYDVIYDKTVENKATFTLPNNTQINLNTLNIETQWKLSIDRDLSKKKERVARTEFRPEDRAVEMTPQEREQIQRDIAKLPEQ